MKITHNKVGQNLNLTDSAKFLQITKKQWTSRWKDLGLPNLKSTIFKAACSSFWIRNV